jgi:D-alanine-D-alanine ligase
MKEVCREHGIATPRSVLARNEDDVERAAQTLEFPMFVKHHNSYASVALSRASRVQSPAGLRRQARKFISRFGASLIEEYIDGAECTVLVAENPDDAGQPVTYVPLQYRFPDGESFKHEKIKWVDFDGLQSFPVEDETLANRLRAESARFFHGLNGAGFGRCDIRLDSDGTPYMLEINPNCGVFYPPSAPGSADLCLMHDPAGHEGFTRLLVRAALARHARQNGSDKPLA